MTPNASRPVTVGAFAASLSVIIGWLLAILTPYDPPAEVSGAIAVVIYFIVALFVPDTPTKE
jgi:hypothetical protein